MKLKIILSFMLVTMTITGCSMFGTEDNTELKENLTAEDLMPDDPEKAMEAMTENTKDTPPVTHLLDMTVGEYHPADTMQISVFGNPGCGRCDMVTEFLEAHEIPFVEYSLKDKKNSGAMHHLVRWANGGKPTSVHYPVVVINDKVHYNIPRLQEFLDQLLIDYDSSIKK